jgi:hypothetical protein
MPGRASSVPPAPWFPGCGINFHASYAAFLVQENVVQHKLRSNAAGAKRSESTEGSREPARLSILSAEPPQGLSRHLYCLPAQTQQSNEPKHTQNDGQHANGLFFTESEAALHGHIFGEGQV